MASVSVTLTNKGSLPLYYGAGSLCANLLDATTWSTYPLTTSNKDRYISLPAGASAVPKLSPCDTSSSTHHVVGMTFYAPGAVDGDVPVAWYFYDYSTGAVALQRDSPLVNLTAKQTATALALTVNPTVTAVAKKYWWIALIVLAVVIALVVGIVMGVRRRRAGK